MTYTCLHCSRHAAGDLARSTQHNPFSTTSLLSFVFTVNKVILIVDKPILYFKCTVRKMMAAIETICNNGIAEDFL